MRKPKRQRIDLDGPMSSAELHERVERLAVPIFDWASEPILAIAEGVTSLRVHHLGRTVGPEPGIATPSR